MHGDSPPPATGEVLLILGASVRAAAQSARRAGFRPFAADLFADADLAACCPCLQISDYSHGAQELWLQAPPGGWMYTGALENEPALIERLARLRPLYGNSADVLRRVRDPRQLAAMLERNGLPRLEIRTRSDGLPTDGSWMRKPLCSGGGRGVSRWRGNETPGFDCDPADIYFQQWTRGTPCSASYFAAGGSARLLGTTRQLVGRWQDQAADTGISTSAEMSAAEESFEYRGSIGPGAIAEGADEPLVRLGEALAAEFQLCGLFGVDGIWSADQFWPVEVNPRYTASIEILERAFETSLVAWHVEACRSSRLPRDLPTQNVAPRQRWGKRVVFAEADQWINQTFLEAIAADLEAGWLADLPRGGTQIALGQPLLTVFAAGHTVPEVQAALAARSADVQSLLASTRNVSP